MSELTVNGITIDDTFAEAFELLRSAARNSRREVKAIAQELGTSRKTPAEIAELLPSSDVNDAGA